MFQYATARRLAYLRRDTLKLDICGFKDYPDRAYALGNFKIAGQIATVDEIAQIQKIQHIKEAYFHFDPLMMRLQGDVYLEGYWQCEKYFKEISSVLRSEFTVTAPLTGGNLELANQIRSCEAVALHFRRGDYVSNPVAADYHGQCPVDYYRKALRKLVTKVQAPHFFLFSDDPDWVKQEVTMNYPFTVVGLNPPAKAYEDLRLMSLCQYHIVANSSFSWWGAWLATGREKEVYAPRQWFKNAQHYTRDLIPEAWNLI